MTTRSTPDDDSFVSRTLNEYGAKFNEVLNSPRVRRYITRRRIHFALDFLTFLLALALAYLLRFDFAPGWDNAADLLRQAAYVVPLQMLMLWYFDGYRLIWRYVGMSEIGPFVRAAVASCGLLVLVRLLPSPVPNDWRVPLSIALIDAGLGFGGVLGLRIARRAVDEWKQRRKNGERAQSAAPAAGRKAVLLIGAGRAGVLAAREIQGRGDMNLDIKGFVDDDLSKHGKVISRIPVLGTTDDLPRLVRELGIDHVVITIAQTSRDNIRRIVRACEKIPVRVRVIPGLYEILLGHVEVSRLRDVQIEDLLGRDPVDLDIEGICSFLGGKTVMVTGAGGSIGSELVRQIARFGPSCLLLVERAEPALFQIDREVRELVDGFPIVPLIADVGDESRMRHVMEEYRPQVIFHAAAHKHVPMMESNATEAVKNNVLATHNVGRLAGEFGAEVFVLISTDKAVRPTSVMGASKRMAELAAQSLNGRYATRYVSVRFGNVIGSAGSVIPIFREQIRKGGPVTVTHPDMVRYFMTIPEAAQLVLQAGGIGQGGEILILDMGEPVKILDLALDTITLSGYKPYEDIDVVVTGMRPGEKLFEELAFNEEQITKTRHPKIFIGKVQTYAETVVGEALARLSELSARGDEQAIRRYVSDLLPESNLTLGGADDEEARGDEPAEVQGAEAGRLAAAKTFA